MSIKPSFPIKFWRELAAFGFFAALQVCDWYSTLNAQADRVEVNPVMVWAFEASSPWIAMTGAKLLILSLEAWLFWLWKRSGFSHKQMTMLIMFVLNAIYLIVVLNNLS